jgi:hypothetical protein
VETPNAEAGVKFSHPVIEASYDRITGVSVFKAYTVALTLTNRATSKVRQVPQGTQVVIQKESVALTPITSEIVPTAQEELQEKPPEQAPVPQKKPPEPVAPPSPPATMEQPVAPPPTQSDVLQQAHSVTRGATSSSAPISVGTVGTGETTGTESTATGGTTEASGTEGTTTTETSTNPSPGTRPETAETRTYHAITITIRPQ